jgi:iron complex outermembrane receptor protein
MLAAVAICLGAVSASPAEGQGGAADLSEIDVRGQLRRGELQSTSATVLGNKDVSDRVNYQPSDLFTMSPGVSVLQYGESGVSPNIQIRGFTLMNDKAIYLDGIPLHDNGHQSGFTDSTVVMPIEIESMEIIKGPASVLYGARSAGGTIAIQTIKGGNLTRLNARYGSWNDVNVTGILARDNGKFAQVYAFEEFHTDGYRDNSAWDRQNFSGSWTYNATEKLQVRFNLRAFRAEWDSAGYVSKILNGERDAVDDGTGSKNNNGGKRSRFDGRLWLNYMLDNKSQLTYYAYGTTLEFTRYMRGALLVGQTPGGTVGNMSLQFNKHRQWGTGITYNWMGLLGGKDATFTAGFTFSKDIDSPRQDFTVPWGQGRRITGPPASDVSLSISNPAVLAEFTYQLVPQLNVRVGARYDWLSGKYTDNLSGANSKVSHTFFSPKVGVLYTPTEGLDLYANFSRGFSMPSTFYGGLGNMNNFFNSTTNPKLMKRDQYELGARYAPADWLKLELGVFLMKTFNDVTTDPVTGDSEQTGKTTRRGVEFGFDASLAPGWRLWGNYAYSDAFYDDYKAGGLDYKGRRIPLVPRHLANLELSYQQPGESGFGGRVSLRLEHDMVYSDEPPARINGSANASPGGRIRTPWHADDITYVDLQLSYRFNGNHRILLDVKNVFDKRYEGYKYNRNYDTGDYLVTYRNPRAIYLTYQLNFDQK